MVSKTNVCDDDCVLRDLKGRKLEVNDFMSKILHGNVHPSGPSIRNVYRENNEEDSSSD